MEISAALQTALSQPVLHQLTSKQRQGCCKAGPFLHELSSTKSTAGALSQALSCTRLKPSPDKTPQNGQTHLMAVRMLPQRSLSKGSLDGGI